jgi:hypothetical protein
VRPWKYRDDRLIEQSFFGGSVLASDKILASTILRRRVRIFRFVGAAIMILTSGSAIPVDNGLHMVVYLVIGLAFPLISAWLMAPPRGQLIDGDRRT